MADRKARGSRAAAPAEDEFADLLRQGSECYEAGEAYEDMTFEKIPDGTGYLGRLSLCEWRKSKAGNLMLWREHIVLDGEFAGLVVRDWLLYGKSEFGDGKIRKYIKLVTGEALPKDPGELSAIVKKINDELAYDCEFNVATNNGFTNVDITTVFEIDPKIDLDKITEAREKGQPTPSGAMETKEAPADDANAKLLEDVQGFVDRQGMKDEMKKKKLDFDDIEDLKKIIGGYDYDPVGAKEGLSQEDADLLTDIGLGECIKQPEPEPAPARSARKAR
jgi:hypothetical protein